MIGVARAVVMGASGRLAQSPPTINGAESLTTGDTVDPFLVSLASQTYTAGDYLLAVAGGDGADTFTGMAGDSDDTYTEVAEVNHASNGSNLATYEGTVVGSLDANLSIDRTGARDVVGGLITISGAAANASQPNVAPSTNQGQDASPVCSSVTTDVDNCLVFAIFHARGGHTPATIQAAVPPGWTFLAAQATGTTEGSTGLSTLGIAYKVQETAGATGNATWTNALDASQRWTTQQYAVAPGSSGGGGGSPGGGSEFITTPEDNGWSDENTNAQNTTAFQAAIDAASAAAGSPAMRGVVELVPSKTYTVVVGTNGSNNDPTTALTSKSNVEIRTQGSPTGATRAVIQSESWSGKSGIHNRAILIIENSDNFRIGYVIVDGNKNSIDSLTDVDYTEGQNGGVHNIKYAGANSNVVCKHLKSQNSLTDGLYLRQGDNISAASALFEDCSFSRNRRNNASIIQSGSSTGGYDQTVFRRCAFNDAGDFTGDVAGQQPGSGIDIEPSNTGNHNYGLTFEDDCECDGNLGSEWHQGINTGSFSAGRGFQMDSQANLGMMRIIDFRNTNNRDGFTLLMRDNASIDDVRIENLVNTGNTLTNRLTIGSGGGSGNGHITNAEFINCDVSEYFFRDDLPATGHDVTIWKGNFDPTVTTNGATTITANAGVPVIAVGARHTSGAPRQRAALMGCGDRRLTGL